MTHDKEIQMRFQFAIFSSEVCENEYMTKALAIQPNQLAIVNSNNSIPGTFISVLCFVSSKFFEKLQNDSRQSTVWQLIFFFFVR